MNDLPIAHALKSDPRLLQAKKLILETVADHQKKLTSVRPPLSNLKINYDQLIESFSEIRGVKLWYPYIGSGIGNGVLVELLDGSVKYDLICGVGVHYFGHSHPNYIGSAIDAASFNTILQTNLQQNENALILSRALQKASQMDHCFLSTSGAMANENALKMIFQKKYPAQRILAFKHCFAGRTLFLSQITDKPEYREGLPNFGAQIDYVPFFEPSNPKASIQGALDTIDSFISLHPGEHAAMIFELIQGEGGINIGTKEFFHEIMKLLKKHHIAILIDEVQTFGRTPELFAFHYFGLQEFADIVVIGKLALVCAALFSSEFKPKPGLLSQTITASNSAIETSVALLKQLVEGNYYGTHGKVNKIGNHLLRRLQEIEKKYPELLKDPHGIGTMIAFTPFDGTKASAIKFAANLFEAGVISFIAGIDPTRIRFLLPIEGISIEQIDDACRIIEDTLIKT